MLSVAVHKDIAEYQPKLIGKMTSRTLLAVAGALGCSVLTGLYIYFVLGLDVGDCMVLIYAVSLAFWCCGFWKPGGMPFEKYAPLWLKSQLTDDHIFYTPSIVLCGLVKRAEEESKERKGRIYAKPYRKQIERKGIEAYSPRAGRVVW